MECLSGDAYYDLLKVEQKSKEGGVGNVIPFLEKSSPTDLAFSGQCYNLLGTFAAFRHHIHPVLDHLICPSRYTACFRHYW